MRKQKGQGIIEFALVLPLLMMLVFGTAYFAGSLYDYIALRDVAWNVARQASNLEGSDYTSIKNAYKKGGARYPHLFNGIYEWEGADGEFSVADAPSVEGGANDTVVVTITASIPEQRGSFLNYITHMGWMTNSYPVQVSWYKQGSTT